MVLIEIRLDGELESIIEIRRIGGGQIDYQYRNIVADFAVSGSVQSHLIALGVFEARLAQILADVERQIRNEGESQLPNG